MPLNTDDYLYPTWGKQGGLKQNKATKEWEDLTEAEARIMSVRMEIIQAETLRNIRGWLIALFVCLVAVPVGFALLVGGFLS